MKVRELMTDQVVRVGAEETVQTAARLLTHYNIGALPVCDPNGALLGMVTDRDLVVRCMATELLPEKTRVQQVMSQSVEVAAPDMDAAVAAHLMGRKQIRRLPVVENGRLCGMLTLGDLSGSEENILDAADALSDISTNVTYG